jgi:archaeosine-15-forming tRNA-guanine transglycosylase
MGQGGAGARSREALIEAMGKSLEAVRASDARGFFEHRGYRLLAYALDHPAMRLLVHIRDFFVRSGLTSYCLFDSSSHESQKSTPDYIDNYAAYETRGQ